MKGTELFIAALRHEQVEVIFGYPGGMVLPVFDALGRDGSIRFVLPRHEQAGIHMADAYARITGRVGVVFATSGPGATNLVTGIANACMDSVPLVVFTGQVKTELIGNDAFQEVDFTGITRSISKHNYLVKNPEDLPTVIHEAFHIASTGRPGPVVVDLPINICLAEIKAPVATTVNLRGYKPTLRGNARQIEKAAEIVNAAARPVLLLGGGVIISGATDAARELAARADLPVASTLMGLGAFPGRDRRHLGMLGMHGTVVANRAVTACDTLIAVGVRFDDRVTGKISGFAPQARIVHIDVDPTSVSKNVPVDTPIVGDARLILEDLLPRVAAPAPGARAAWQGQIEAWRAEFPLAYGHDGLKPQYVLEELARQTAGRETTIVTDVGQHQMWTALFYPFDRPRSLVTSGGLGTMGFGLPAGLGAQLAAPGRLTVVVTGDGGFQMNIQELATAKRLDLPVKILLLDNGCLGMVRQLQEMFFEKRYVYTDLSDNPDFVAVAAAYGIPAERCERAADVPAAIARMLAAPGPSFLDVRIDREENVVPMVPSGEAIDHEIGGLD